MTEGEQKALRALRTFVQAAIDLDAAWTDLPAPGENRISEVLCEGYPDFLPSFDDAVTKLLAWRDAVTAKLGEHMEEPDMITACLCCGNCEQDLLKVSTDPSTGKKYLVCLRCDTAREWPEEG